MFSSLKFLSVLRARSQNTDFGLNKAGLSFITRWSHLESLCYKEVSCFKGNVLLVLRADAEICCSVIPEGLQVPRETNLKMFVGRALQWWECSPCALFSAAAASTTWLLSPGNVAGRMEELNFKLHCLLMSLSLSRHLQLTATVLDSAVPEGCFFSWETSPLSPKGYVNP